VTASFSLRRADLVDDLRSHPVITCRRRQAAWISSGDGRDMMRRFDLALVIGLRSAFRVRETAHEVSQHQAPAGRTAGVALARVTAPMPPTAGAGEYLVSATSSWVRRVAWTQHRRRKQIQFRPGRRPGSVMQ
jgi:hypothetical protein